MPKRDELTEAERAQIILLQSQGISLSAIAKQMKRSRCAITTTIKRHRETGSYKNRPKNGRKRKTTARNDRLLQRMCLRNRKRTSEQLAGDLLEESNVTISARTIRRRLTEFGLKGCKPRHKPYLTQEHKKKRLLWAKRYLNWTVDDWAKVMWSDESNIQVCYGQY